MNIAYFKQNIKKEAKGYRSFFKQSSKLYNLAVSELNKQLKEERGYRGWKSIQDALNSSDQYILLGSQISTSIIRNLDINYSNYLKKSVEEPAPTFRRYNFFVAFFSFYEKDNVLTIKLSDKFKEKYGVSDFKFNIPKNFKYINNTNQIRFHIKNNGEFYLVYNYKYNKKYVNRTNRMGIDLGVDNLFSCYMEKGTPFIIKGKRLKFINYLFFNKYIDYNKKENKSDAYINDAISYIFKVAINNNVGEIYVGYFKHIKNNKVSKNFYYINYTKIIRKLRDYGRKHNIKVIFGDESYTSKCSFYDEESVEYHEKYIGNRETRGLFITKDGYKINADINGSANILVKLSKKVIKNRKNVLLSPRILNK